MPPLNSAGFFSWGILQMGSPQHRILANILPSLGADEVVAFRRIITCVIARGQYYFPTLHLLSPVDDWRGTKTLKRAQVDWGKYR